MQEGTLRQRAKGLVVAVTLVLVPHITLASPSADAHAQLTSSQPADGAVLDEAPPEVVLDFDEPVEAPPRALVLLADGRDELELPAEVGADPTRLRAVTPRPLPAGDHELSWRALSLDGHVIEGTVTFTVEGAEREPGAPDGAFEGASVGPSSSGPAERSAEAPDAAPQPQRLAAASPVTERSGRPGAALATLVAAAAGAAGLLLLGRRRSATGAAR